MINEILNLFLVLQLKKKIICKYHFFFHKIIKDEGKIVNPKAAIIEILEKENRLLYKLSYNTPIHNRSQKIRIIDKKN